MTYDLYIGKREIEDGQATVANIYNTDAPAFPNSSASRHTNRVCIPYGGDFFKLLDKHDKTLSKRLNTWGVWDVPITANFVRRLRHVSAVYHRAHPKAIPSFEHTDANATYARLLILIWWASYSLREYGPDAMIRISA